MADQTIQVNCGFFDSINNDRLYAAEQINKPYYRLISNGVFATPQGTPSTDLQVIASGEDMNITVKKGDGIFADKWFENPSNISFEVPNNTAIVPRRDSIIAQVDKTTNGRAGNIVYRTGEPGSNPQSPEINTNANIVEYRIANIYVGAGVTIITQSNITDLRGSAECPWVTSLVQQVDLSELFAQYQNWFEERKQQAEDDFDDFEESQESEFITWFNRMKGQLSEDAAGNLQNEIDNINDNKYDKSDVYNKEEIQQRESAFMLKPATLFVGNTGVRDSQISLLDNVENYDDIEIFYRRDGEVNEGSPCKSIKIPVDQTYAQLDMIYATGHENIYLQFSSVIVKIQGNKITYIRGAMYGINTGGNIPQLGQEYNYIITKVIGHKYTNSNS